jgi:hypothetical protein
VKSPCRLYKSGEEGEEGIMTGEVGMRTPTLGDRTTLVLEETYLGIPKYDSNTLLYSQNFILLF